MRHLGLIVRDHHLLLIRCYDGPHRGQYYGLEVQVPTTEEPAAALCRQAATETGLTLDPRQTRRAGRIRYQQDAGDDELQLWLSLNPAGEPRRTPERWPIWFVTTHLPWPMLPSDWPHWTPKVLLGKIANGTVRLKPGGHLAAHHLHFIAAESVPGGAP